MKVTLKKYFNEKHSNSSELIGLKVVTIEDENFYINDFDNAGNESSLPDSFFLSKKQGSNYGVYKDTASLYVEVETWETTKK